MVRGLKVVLNTCEISIKYTRNGMILNKGLVYTSNPLYEDKIQIICFSFTRQ